MKKIIKIGIVIIAFTLSLYNVLLANYPGGGDGCELSAGSNLAGTHCWITDVHGPAIKQFQFNTLWCTSTCPLGGTNCCYALEVRQE